jgi:hypothetical protein
VMSDLQSTTPMQTVNDAASVTAPTIQMGH